VRVDGEDLPRIIENDHSIRPLVVPRRDRESVLVVRDVVLGHAPVHERDIDRGQDVLDVIRDPGYIELPPIEDLDLLVIREEDQGAGRFYDRIPRSQADVADELVGDIAGLSASP
jgi:hypothetical protein